MTVSFLINQGSKDRVMAVITHPAIRVNIYNLEASMKKSNSRVQGGSDYGFSFLIVTYKIVMVMPTCVTNDACAQLSLSK